MDRMREYGSKESCSLDGDYIIFHYKTAYKSGRCCRSGWCCFCYGVGWCCTILLHILMASDMFSCIMLNMSSINTVSLSMPSQSLSQYSHPKTNPKNIFWNIFHVYLRWMLNRRPHIFHVTNLKYVINIPPIILLCGWSCWMPPIPIRYKLIIRPETFLIKLIKSRHIVWPNSQLKFKVEW